jgi:mRNA interferase RelE/StbE
MFEVILSPDAQTFYAAADRPLARKLARCFAQLEHDPTIHGNIKRLSGELSGAFRFRVGDWRVLYRIDHKADRVLVLTIAHRREVYD